MDQNFPVHQAPESCFVQKHFSLFKAATYDGRQKMKGDAQLKVVFFLGKKTTLTQASLLIFRRL